MSPSIVDSTTKILINDEGYSETPYLDSKGNYTIGVGHLIGKLLSELKLSRSVIEFMLREQIDICIKELIEIFGIDDFYSWQEPRQVALISMIYTLGKSRFLSFQKMIHAIKLAQWKAAANQCLMSKWAIDVDPQQRPGIGRDDRVAYMIREGKFHEIYKIDS